MSYFSEDNGAMYKGKECFPGGKIADVSFFPAIRACDSLP